MGKDLCAASPAAKALFDQADQILGFSLSSVCFEGPQEKLNQTDIAQPAIFVTSAAAFAAAVEKGVLPGEVEGFFAGLSLGEYTALYLAGVFSFADGVKLVAARGKYMQEAATATASGMSALIGADEATANAICAEAAQGEVLVPANFNAPGQIVISGAIGACQRANQIAEGKGIKAIALAVAGAFHSPLMQSAADKMKVELEKAAFSAPKKPVYSNVTAGLHGDVNSIKDLLVRQIVSPVRWEPTLKGLVENAELKLVELQPGRTLTGMAKKINRRVSIEAL